MVLEARASSLLSRARVCTHLYAALDSSPSLPLDPAAQVVPSRAKEGAATTVWATGALHRDKGAGALRAALRWRIAPAG